MSREEGRVEQMRLSRGSARAVVVALTCAIAADHRANGTGPDVLGS
jgi:hypothetical protein